MTLPARGRAAQVVIVVWSAQQKASGSAVINDSALFDAGVRCVEATSGRELPVRPASVAALVPIVSGGVRTA